MKNILSNKKVIPTLMFALQKKSCKNNYNYSKSILDYRFNSNTHTHMFLLVTQAFWVFICFYWCAIWVCLKLLNGSPACDYLTQTSWQVMQRDSDIADSGVSEVLRFWVEIKYIFREKYSCCMFKKNVFWAQQILGGRQNLWGIAVAPDACNVTLRQKKHDQICSRASTSTKMSFLM